MSVNFLALNIPGVRKTILDISYNSGEPSHIGGALSIVDILAVIYSNFNI